MKQPARVVRWVEKQKKKGHEIRLTPNGHPYAVLSMTKRLPKTTRVH